MSISLSWKLPHCFFLCIFFLSSKRLWFIVHWHWNDLFFSFLFCSIRLSSVHVYDCCSRFVVSRPSEYANKYPPWQRILSFIKYHCWTRDNLLVSNLSGKYEFFHSNKTNWNSRQYFDLHFHKSQKCASKQIMKLRIILCDIKSALLL